MARYPEIIRNSNRTIVKVGDRIPLAGVEVLLVTSDAQVQRSPLAGAPGAGLANSACADFTRKTPAQQTDPDNDHSVGFVLNFGSFRTINLGDFMWNLEYELMCPNNPLNAPGIFIANLDEPAILASVLNPPQLAAGQAAPATNPAHSPAHWIKVSTRADGSFTVTNSRNGFSKTYAARTH